MTIPNAQELFRNSLAGVFKEAMDAMPQSKDLLTLALTLISGGHVVKEGGCVIVHDGDNKYMIDIEKQKCPCAEAEERNGLCRHRLAMRMFMRTKDVTDAKLRALEDVQQAIPLEQSVSPEDGKTEFHKEYEQAGGVDFDDIPEPAVPDSFLTPDGAVKSEVQQWNHEPHSITMKGVTEDGYEFLFCLRGHNVNDLIKQVRSAKQEMQRMQIRGTYSTSADTQKASAAPKASSEDTQPRTCLYHKVPLEEKSGKSGTYFAHKVGDKFCYGNWCAEHDESYRWRDKKDGRGGWWSHKAGDSYCNYKKGDT